jgi:ubiquinone biosynthesis protein COQ9
LVPEGYGDLVGLIGAEVRTTRLRAARAANTELVRMNWRIGRLILERQQTQPWGSAVIRKLAADLRREFPMTGLSATNLQYMRAFAAAWTSEPIPPQPVLGTAEAHTVTVIATDSATRVGCSRNC